MREIKRDKKENLGTFYAKMFFSLNPKHRTLKKLTNIFNLAIRERTVYSNCVVCDSQIKANECELKLCDEHRTARENPELIERKK